MGWLQILQSDQYDQWMEVLEQSTQYDFYHLPSYHALAEGQGEGRAHLFIYREEQYFIAIPLMLRSVGEITGLEYIGKDYGDATSVYGYVGPITSHSDVPALVLR